jgi:hypothetical protein
MTHRSPRQLLVALLAILVTLGMTFSVVQATTMAAMNDMTSTMAKRMMGGHKTCGDCPGGEDAAKAIACGSACVSPMVATLPPTASAPARLPSLISIKRESLRQGRVPAPDPYPPRPADFA